MKFKIKVEDQMADLSFKNPFSWFISLTFFLLCLGNFLGLIKFSSFLLTSTALIMSMFYFSISKKYPIPIHKFIQEQKKVKSFVSDQKSSPETGEFSSESEYADDNFTTTEESEVEWPFSDRAYMDRSDDGSISDEESLIEIALPTGHYVSNKFDDDEEEKDDMSFYYQKLSDFQKENMNFVELSAEINDINEEENLIEIDISIGSIKYSRFEIEA